MLEVGTKAPAFELPDQDGVIHTLEEYRGKKVILYFYPKDNTP
ncbi:MAG: redoxin domain-containing protein, partial [Lachnospiraceae bacterium]